MRVCEWKGFAVCVFEKRQRDRDKQTERVRVCVFEREIVCVYVLVWVLVCNRRELKY